MVTRRLIQALVVLSSIVAAEISDAAPTYTLLALDNTASDVPGENYIQIEPGFINASGRVVFNGHVTGVEDYVAVARPSPAQLIALAERTAPGTPTGVEFLSVGAPNISADNQIAFNGSLTGPGISLANKFGIWAGAPSQPQLVVQGNDLAPGAGTARFDSFFEEFDLSNNGVVTFIADLTDNRHGIWSGAKGAIQPIAISGNAAPGVTGTFNSFYSTRPPASNNSGHVVFEATVNSATIFHSGIWSGTPGNISLIARDGIPAPGMGDNKQIDLIWLEPQINHANEVAFSATVLDTNTIDEYDVLYLKSSSGLQPIVVQGDVAPGFPAGSTFQTISDFHLGGPKRAAFFSQVTLPNEDISEALFVYDNGAKRLVARQDQQIPGVPVDTRFDIFRDFFINENGRVAFMANTVGDSSFTGLWVENDIGQLMEVVREGQQLEVSPGVFRTVTDVAIGTDFWKPHNSRLPWNAAGQLVFQVSFGVDDALYLFDLNGASTLPGDFNHDGTVDAADYTVWRDGLGDEYDQSDYNDWKSHFGQSQGAGAASTAAVPEPATVVLLLATAALISLRRR